MTDQLLRRLLRYMINSTVQQTFGLGQRACDSFGCRDGNVPVLIMCRDNGQSVIVAISLILPNQGKLGAGCTQSRISGREVSSWDVGTSCRLPGIWGQTKHRAATESNPDVSLSALLLCASFVLFCAPHHPGPRDYGPVSETPVHARSICI